MDAQMAQKFHSCYLRVSNGKYLRHLRVNLRKSAGNCPAAR
jgi:hypothetical protein